MAVTPALMGTLRTMNTARKPSETAAAASSARGMRLPRRSAAASSAPRKNDR
jgi:hypothetical protein